MELELKDGMEKIQFTVKMNRLTIRVQGESRGRSQAPQLHGVAVAQKCTNINGILTTCEVGVFSYLFVNHRLDSAPQIGLCFARGTRSNIFPSLSRFCRWGSREGVVAEVKAGVCRERPDVSTPGVLVWTVSFNARIGIWPSPPGD